MLTADCIATLIPAEVGTRSVLAAAPMGILSETAMSSTPTTGSSEDVLLQHGAPHSWALQGSNRLNLSAVADLAVGFWVPDIQQRKISCGGALHVTCGHLHV